MALGVSGQAARIGRNYHFWLIVAAFAICTFLQLSEILWPSLPSPLLSLGVTRHTLSRILLLLPITYVGLVFRMKAGLASLAIAVVIMLPRAIFFSPTPIDALIETGGIVVIGGLANLWLERYRRERESREMLFKLEAAQRSTRFFLQQVARAQEEERQYIARELHDETTQELVALLHRLDSIPSSAGYLSAQDISRLEELRQHIQRILDGTRRFSQRLRPFILDDLGILPALEWLTSDFTEQFGIAIDMAVYGQERRFPPEVELTLFRIAQEALRNVRKHSEASKTWLTVEFGDDKTVLTVKDNGKGFNSPKRMEDLVSAGKLGLVGMQERAQLIGGKLTLQSEPGKGTTASVEVPI